MPTITIATDPAGASVARHRAAALNERIADRGLDGNVTVECGPTVWRRNDLGLTEPSVDVTVTWDGLLALPGDWTLVATADFTSADTPLVFNLDGTTDLTPADVDQTRCDHCGTSRQRNTVYVLRSTDGEIVHVGSSCIADFLGHDAAHLAYAAAIASEIADEDSWGGFGGVAADYTLAEFVAAAYAAVQTLGWAPAASDYSTRSAALDVLGRPTRCDSDEILRARELLADPANLAHVAAAIEWAASIDPSNDFEHNLTAVANSAHIGHRAWGIAAYLPVAYDRHLDAEAHRRAEVERRPDPTPCPTGRVEVTGEIVGLSWRDTGYGSALKATIIDDRGFRVWVTVPRANSDDAERGHRVTFTATLTRSDDDETFGFGKRPTHWADHGPAAEAA